MFGKLLPESVNATLLANPAAHFEFYDQAVPTVKTTVRGRPLMLAKDVKPMLKEHDDLCDCRTNTPELPSLNVSGWSFCKLLERDVRLFAVDFCNIPGHELLVPTKKLTEHLNEQSLTKLIKDQSSIDFQHAIKARVKELNISAQELERLERIYDFIADRRNLLPTLKELGQNLRARYESKHGHELPHGLLQIGRDIPVDLKHNADRCQEMDEQFKQHYQASMPFIKVHQHYRTADFSCLYNKHLPDVEMLILETVKDYLAEKGINAKLPIFVSFVPSDIAGPIVIEDLFLELPGSDFVEHGPYSHVFQIAALLNAGLIDKPFLKKIIEWDLWVPLFDQATHISSRLTHLKTNNFNGLYFNLQNYTSAMPQTIQSALASGQDSQAISDILESGDQERIIDLWQLFHPTEAKRPCFDNVVIDLKTAQQNLQALEVSLIDTQAKGIVRKEGDVEAAEFENYFCTNNRNFDTASDHKQAMLEYMKRGWSVQQVVQNGERHVLKLIHREAELLSSTAKSFVLYPPAAEQPFTPQ